MTNSMIQSVVDATVLRIVRNGLNPLVYTETEDGSIILRCQLSSNEVVQLKKNGEYYVLTLADINTAQSVTADGLTKEQYKEIAMLIGY